MALTIILRIGVRQKVKIILGLALTIASLTRRIMLSFCVATLFSFTSFLLIRLRVFSTIRVGIFDESRHELPHVIAVAFKPPQLLLEGKEPTILLQN